MAMLGNTPYVAARAKSRRQKQQIVHVYVS